MDICAYTHPKYFSVLLKGSDIKKLQSCSFKYRLVLSTNLFTMSRCKTLSPIADMPKSTYRNTHYLIINCFHFIFLYNCAKNLS